MTATLFFSIFGLIGFAISFYLMGAEIHDRLLQKRKDVYLKGAIDQYMKLVPKIMGQIKKAAGDDQSGTWEDLSRDMAERVRELLQTMEAFFNKSSPVGPIRSEYDRVINSMISAGQSLKNFDYYIAMQEEKND